MSTFFLQIFNMSITASYSILTVLLLRLFLKKAPKKYSYFMWLVSAFRLSCPFSFESMFSIFNARPFHLPVTQGGLSIQHIPPDIGMAASPRIFVGVDAIDNAISASLPASNPVASANPMQIIVFLATAVWFFGMAVLLIYSLCSYGLLRVKLKNAVLLRDNIYQSDKVTSPFVFGLVRPKIYLPFHLDEATTAHAIAHEQYHIKRKDHLIKPFAFALLILHWFNPLCWIAFLLMNADMEMSCDEKVLSSETILPKNYSHSLLFFATDRRLPAPCPLAFCETGVKGRIRHILQYKKPKLYISLLSLILCISIIAVFVGNPKQKDLFVPMSEDDLSRYSATSIGSIMADLDYADDQMVIFHYLGGFFLYNQTTDMFDLCLDLTRLNIAGHHQGSNGTAVEIDENLKKAYLINYGPEDEIQTFDDYQIDLSSGRVTVFDPDTPRTIVTSYSDTHALFPDAKGWFSNTCVINGEKTYYLAVEGEHIGEIKLVTVSIDGNFTEKNLFHAVYPSTSETEQEEQHTSLPEEDAFIRLIPAEESEKGSVRQHPLQGTEITSPAEESEKGSVRQHPLQETEITSPIDGGINRQIVL